jgi:hypothetical protein
MNLKLKGFGISVLDIAGLYQQHAAIIAGKGAADLYGTTSVDLLGLGPSEWGRVKADVDACSFAVGQGMEVLEKHPVWEGILHRGTDKNAILRHARDIRASSGRLNLCLREALTALGVPNPTIDESAGLETATLLITALNGISAGLSAKAIADDPESFGRLDVDLRGLAEDVEHLEHVLMNLDDRAADLYKHFCVERVPEKAWHRLNYEALGALSVSSIPSARTHFDEAYSNFDELERLLPGTIYSNNMGKVRNASLSGLLESFEALSTLQNCGANDKVLHQIQEREALEGYIKELENLLAEEVGHVRNLEVYSAEKVRGDRVPLETALEDLRSARRGSKRRRDAKRVIAAYTKKGKWQRILSKSVSEAEKWLSCLRVIEENASAIQDGYGISTLNPASTWGISKKAKDATVAFQALEAFPALKSVGDVDSICRALAGCWQASTELGNYGLDVGGTCSMVDLATKRPLLRKDFGCLDDVSSHAAPYQETSVRSVFAANEALKVKRRFVERLRDYLASGGNKLSPLGRVDDLDKRLSSRDTLEESRQRIQKISDAARRVSSPDKYRQFSVDCTAGEAATLAGALSVAQSALRDNLRSAVDECTSEVDVPEADLLRFFVDVSSDESLEAKLVRLQDAAKRLVAVRKAAGEEKLDNLCRYLLSHRGSTDMLRNARERDVTSSTLVAKAALLAPLLGNTWVSVQKAAHTEFAEDTSYLGDSYQLANLLKEYRELEPEEASKELKRARAEIDEHRRTRYRQLATDPSTATAMREASRFLANYGAHGTRTNSRTRIREAVAKPGYMHLLKTLTPCFIASPDSASTYLPLVGPKFDVLIFDEASQIMPIRAAACLGRAESVVVAGDSKQLPPTNFFNSSQEDDEESNEEDFYDESLLERAAKASHLGLMASASLLWHYRSRHDGLIRFSNEKFYGGTLQWFTASDRDTGNGGVSFHHVRDAVYHGKGVNDATARRSLELAREELAKGVSVGIVTFSKAQADYINTNLIMNEFFDEMKDVDRENPVTGFFVKNLENVQGDERDVIVLDFPYGKDEDGLFLKHFGPLSQRSYGERRINVAITRARNRMHVVSGVVAGDFGAVDKESGAGLLRDFLEYAESTPPPHRRARKEKETESPFEAEILAYIERVLEELGVTHRLEVHTQVGCRGYRIDMAIYDVQARRYILGIECDGAAFHSSPHSRTRDRIRHEQIVSMGWQLYHIWGGGWFSRRDEEARALRTKIESVLQQA